MKAALTLPLKGAKLVAWWLWCRCTWTFLGLALGSWSRGSWETRSGQKVPSCRAASLGRGFRGEEAGRGLRLDSRCQF
jgi:hypothetical protein